MNKTRAQLLGITEFPFIIKNEKGQILYEENSYGFWYESEYDKNDNLICSKFSDGYWIQNKYDENNNCIYYETSGGFWQKFKYDANNNKIYYEKTFFLFISLACKGEYNCFTFYIKLFLSLN